MAEGVPAICIDARHAKAALDMAPNKTDANDADGLSHLAEIGFFREVRVKGFDSMLIRTLVTARVCVGGIVLLPLDEWLHIMRWDQLHLVTGLANSRAQKLALPLASIATTAGRCPVMKSQNCRRESLLRNRRSPFIEAPWS